MKYIVCEKPREFVMKEKAEPIRKEGEVLLKIKRIGICGTDIHAFGGTQPYFEYPRVLGHELAAEFVEGDVPGFKPGDKVTFIPYFHCGKCVACRTGNTNCCAHMKVFGVHIDGGMAEYVSVPAEALLQGEGLDYDVLALIEPLAIAAHGIRRAAVRPHDTVLVIGAGPIGLGLIQFAQVEGARVIAMDVNDHRLAFCREQLKADATINAASEDVVERLKEITGGDMPTVVIDATGNRNAMNAAFGYMAHSGRYVLVGLQKGELSFSHPEFHKRESTLMSSRNATREDFAHVIACIRSGKVDARKYITHRTGFDTMIDQFPSWLDPANGVIKALVEL